MDPFFNPAFHSPVMQTDPNLPPFALPPEYVHHMAGAPPPDPMILAMNGYRPPIGGYHPYEMNNFNQNYQHRPTNPPTITDNIQPSPGRMSPCSSGACTAQRPSKFAQKFETSSSSTYPFAKESEDSLLTDKVARLYEIIKSLDRNRDGSVTENDLIAVIKDYNLGSTLSDVLGKLLFKQIDRDRDRRITWNDVLIALQTLEKKKRQMRSAKRENKAGGIVKNPYLDS